MESKNTTVNNEFWRLASIIEGARVGTWEWNVQTGETVFNEIWADFLGYTLEELAPVSIETWMRLAHPDDLERSTAKLQRHFAGALPWYDCRCRMRHKDGHWIWVHDRGKVITRTPDGKPLMMFGTHMDISGIMQVEQTLRANEAKYKALFEQSQLGIYLHDMEGRIIDVNEMACQQSGYTRQELLQRSVFDNHPPTLDSSNLRRDVIIGQWKQWQIGQRLVLEGAHQRKDGTIYSVEISTGLVRFNDETHLLAVVQDITERKKANESLSRLQRLESLGVLAGGIAHDFNNLLTGVFGNIDLAANSNSDPEVERHLERAMGAISRARGLTQQLLTFSKGGAPDKRAQALEPVVREATMFALTGSDVAYRFDFPTDLWPCAFDKTQLSQVIDNVVINARHAMSGGGEVAVSAENLLVESTSKGLEPGRYVRLSIADRGIGIPQEVISRIFEPFYTTKDLGHGLGLATSYSIIKKHDGIIEAESQPGEGATFHIYLLAAEEIASSASSALRDYRGSGRILVMDDEPLVRNTMRLMLESFGHEVVETSQGEEAVDFLVEEERAGRSVRAVFFDLTVPGHMGGRVAIEELRKRGIQTPAFVFSGYSDDVVMVHPEDFGFVASLRKPFRRRLLAEILNRHLTETESD